MRLIKTTLSVFVLLGLVSAASAQISISSTDLPLTGAFSFGYKDGATFSAGTGGANQTWTFTAYAWDGLTNLEYLTPNGTPYASSFPNATRCTHESEGTNYFYSYERIASNGFWYQGFGGQSDGFDTLLILDQEAQVVQLPFTYQNSFTSVKRYSYVVGPIVATITDSLIQTADGWGTVNTPYGSYPCLRVFMHNYFITKIGPVPATTVERVGYRWVNQQGSNVVMVNSDPNVSDPNFTVGSLEMLGATLSVNPVSGPIATAFSVEPNYPNPFNPTTTLPFTLASSGTVQFEVYDNTGRLMSSKSISLAAGKHELPIDGSQWSTGTYFARLSAGSNTSTSKLILIK